MLDYLPEDTRKTLAKKGLYPQKGFIMRYLPVPPICLHMSDYKNDKGIVSTDISKMLKSILKKIQDIESSRAGRPNFESSEFESMHLQSAVSRYMRFKVTPKQVRHGKTRFTDPKANENAAKQYLDKMKTLFISKASGYASRAIVTGDPYIGVDEIGIPLEVARRITFEEGVTSFNRSWLQQIVDNGDYIRYQDGSSTFAFALDPKDRPLLKVGQIVHRSIVDGDIVFINRPPTTHGHSLQALSVFVHVDSTMLINPLICAPFEADFDGDCFHVFFPQSYHARSEARELFRVDQQLLSSHTRALNLQLKQDSLLALKIMQRTFFFTKLVMQQLSMFSNPVFSYPVSYSKSDDVALWSIVQLLQGTLPPSMNCSGEGFLIRQGEFMVLNFERNSLPSIITDIVVSILSSEGPQRLLKFYEVILPLLMEFISREGFSISLKDFYIPQNIRDNLAASIERVFSLLCRFSISQVESQLESLGNPVINFIRKHSSLAFLVDLERGLDVSRLVEQIGFVGLQLSDKGKLYSPSVVNDICSHWLYKYQLDGNLFPTKGYGLIRSSFFEGLDPFEEMIHSIRGRELIIRSSSGLTEPGTLFKNLMSILRDVVIRYDGTVRSNCSNMILLFKYGSDVSVPAGEAVGILAATAMSKAAYKAAVSPSESIQTSWALMKEVLLIKDKLLKKNNKIMNDDADRKVILYMNDCLCGKVACKEKAASTVNSFLKKITLQDLTLDFSIEYQGGISLPETGDIFSGLLAHIHLDQVKLDGLACSVNDILLKCSNALSSCGKQRKTLSNIMNRIILIPSAFCRWEPQRGNDQFSSSPCIGFLYDDPNPDPTEMSKTLDFLAHTICPLLLDTVIKGDQRVQSSKIFWADPGDVPKVSGSTNVAKGEVAVEVVVREDMVKSNGDAWKIVLDCCMPVMHLIDTRRSTPYGINQIQDFLGIASAFDQSLQRLCTAVRHVEKGVLNEHFLVVVEAMTSSGRVMGFSRANFQPFFRSLGIEVPFAAATLQTPLKCFEKAADKCHKDRLTSVVAACSWGKTAAIGTGGHFEILWDKKKVSGFEGIDADVYSFLNMVSDKPGKGERVTALLGDDIDLISEDEVVSSPEPVRFDPVGSSSPRSDVGEKGNNSWNLSTPSDPALASTGKWDCGKTSDEPSNLAEAWGPSKGTESPPQRVDSWGKTSEPSDLTEVWSRGRGMESPHAQEKTSSAWNLSGLSDQAETWGSSRQTESPPPRSDGSGKKTSSGWNSSGPSGHAETWGSNRQTESPPPGPDAWRMNSSGRNSPRPSDQAETWGPSRQTESPPARSDGQDMISSWKAYVPSDFAVGQVPPRSDGRGKHSNWNSSGSSEITAEPSTQNWGSSPRGSAESPPSRSDSQAKISSTWNSSGPSVQTRVSSPRGWAESPSRSDDREKCSSWIRSETTDPDVSIGESRHQSQERSRSMVSISRWRKNESQRRDGLLTLSAERAPSIRARLTPEQKVIFDEVEPVLTRLSQILHSSGYNYGDRLSEDDQSYVLDKCFQYHPSRSSKISGEVEFVEINRPEGFPDSRCFFVVGANGQRDDFSYWKCMDNFIRINHADSADGLCPKIFKRLYNSRKL